jgi:hypothetical protein
MPPNFQNGKIYAIRSHQTDKIYIGSTTQTLAVRFGGHKKNMDCSSIQILAFGDAYIELLEEFPCVNKMQLNKREGHLIRTMNCVNKLIAGRTKPEHYKDNKEEFKRYREEHKDEFKRYYKQYKIDNKEQIKQQKGKSNMCGCGIQYTNGHKARHFKTTKHLEFMRTLETTSA